MKKATFLALAIAAIFAVSSCGNSTTPAEAPAVDSTQVDSVTVDSTAVDILAVDPTGMCAKCGHVTEGF